MTPYSGVIYSISAVTTADNEWVMQHEEGAKRDADGSCAARPACSALDCSWFHYKIR